MSWALIAALIWLVAGNLAGMLPSRRGHWPAAALLIATGIPIVIAVARIEGIWVGVLVAVAGLSILRFPAMLVARRLYGRASARRGDRS
ncbi:DUF2484 family protein [Palleronia sediminis]|uniref:DUF2484 family protein n=1 Tax=Palleronia sediminis TaxID=2547833 RepID=A0A4R6ADQ6_9RHOB|nr:DUF2484 family protein [Palleronia sediminis]TDL81980.1 DUF2484 family protein [Palleronia sediminis]